MKQLLLFSLMPPLIRSLTKAGLHSTPGQYWIWMLTGTAAVTILLLSLLLLYRGYCNASIYAVSEDGCCKLTSRVHERFRRKVIK